MVRTAEESALIIWDRDNGVEHFIRRAKFDTNAANLGFLVPAPSRPALHEVNPNLFAELQTPLRRETLHLEDTRPEFYSLLYWLFVARFAPPRVMVSAVSAEPPATKSQVAVLAQQEVGGYEATILQAQDAAALNHWLNRNGYPSNATMTEWLRPYVEKGWIITAFKISRKGNNPVSRPLGLASVRMSFATPRPFYPYREPQTARTGAASPPRSLRLFLLADDGRMAATLGANRLAWGTENVQNLYAQSSTQDTDPSAIPGHVGVEWAGYPQTAFFAPNVRDYAGLPATTRMPGHLTVFLDTQSPRPGVDELYFAPAADETDIKPKPIREYARRPAFSAPVEPLLLLPILGAFGRRRRRR